MPWKPAYPSGSLELIEIHWLSHQKREFGCFFCFVFFLLLLRTLWHGQIVSCVLFFCFFRGVRETIKVSSIVLTGEHFTVCDQSNKASYSQLLREKYGVVYCLAETTTKLSLQMPLCRLEFSITQTAAYRGKYCSMESKVSMQHENISPLAGHVQAEALAVFVKHWNTLQSTKQA